MVPILEFEAKNNARAELWDLVKILSRKSNFIFNNSPVKFVNESNARHTVSFHLSVNCQCLTLEFRDRNKILQGKWQQKSLLSYSKETPKQHIEVYYRIFISALFGEIFSLEIFICTCHIDMHDTSQLGSRNFTLTTQELIFSNNHTHGK